MPRTSVIGLLTHALRSDLLHGFYGFQGFKGTYWVPRIYRYWSGNSFSVHDVTLPLRMPAVLFSLLLCFWRTSHHYRRRKRKKLGLCL